MMIWRGGEEEKVGEKMKKGQWRIKNELKAVMMMVTVQVTLAGVNLFYKSASNSGMNMRILVAYRLLFATAFVVPLALLLERNKRPKLTRTILIQAFFSALLGTISTNLYAESLVLTSATYASAILNLMPAATFIIAIFFRLERLGLSTMAGKAKVMGTFMGLGGALILTFYKGVEIHIWSKHRSQDQGVHVASSHPPGRHHLLGSTFALGTCVLSSMSLVLKAKMSKSYPCDYSSTGILSSMAMIQAFVLALGTERNQSEWKLGWNIRLLTVAYSGIVASGLMVTFTMACVRMKGPLFVSSFTPLILIVVAILGSLLLDESLYVGTIVGGGIIVTGLYIVLWGKSEEITAPISQETFSTTSSPTDGALEKGQNDVALTTAATTTATISILGINPVLFPIDGDHNDCNAEMEEELRVKDEKGRDIEVPEIVEEESQEKANKM